METNQTLCRNIKSLFFCIVLFAFCGLFVQWKLISWLHLTKLTSLTSRMFEVVTPSSNEIDFRGFGSLDEMKIRCKPPSPEVFSSDVMPFLTTSVLPAECFSKGNSAKRMFKGSAYAVRNGSYLHRLVDLGAPCCMRKIERWTEDKINVSSTCTHLTQAVIQIDKSLDHISVECVDHVTEEIVYTDSFMIVHPKEISVQDTSGSSPGGEKLNLFIVGMDATSRLNFMRKMPLTYDFLTTNLSAVVLKGHNKIGECTHTNFIPFLSGLPIHEFYESCAKPQRRKNVSVKLDNCSLLWNKYEDRGYLTFFGEDYANWGPLGYYFPEPFKKQPTDYYLRPSVLYFENDNFTFFQDDFSCLGPKAGFEVLLENFKMIADVNKDKPLFQLLWPGTLGYKDLNYQQRGDKGLWEALKYLHSTGALNKTALVIIGDHGFRKKKYKFTPTGAIEDRMPVGIVVLPPWFEKSYPAYYSNLKANSKKMTSHLDLHQTLLDILDLGSGKEKKDKDISTSSVSVDEQRPGISLFNHIPDDRTCLGAGIALFWCLPCHPRQTLLDEAVKNQVAELMVQLLNTGDHHLCDPRVFTNQGYTVQAVLFATKWDSRDVHRELCTFNRKPRRLQGYHGQPSIEINVPCEVSFDNGLVEIVSVEIATEAANATFHAEVIRYKREVGGGWYLHLTEEIQYHYRNM